MLIQNVSSSAVPAPRLASDSAPVAVAAPQAQAAPPDLPKAAAKTAPEQQKVDSLTPAQLQGAVDNINKAMQQVNANVEFTIDEDTRQTVIKVVESKTGEVIRQFPSEEVLAISRALDNMMQHGLLIKQEA